MIVKLQLPLSSSHPNPPALVYNRARTLTDYVPVADLPREVAAQMAGRPKAYFEAHRSDDGTWLWVKKVADQHW